VGVRSAKTSRIEAEESLQELESLAKSAGAQVVVSEILPLDRPNPAILLGKGKIPLLQEQVSRNKIDIVLFDEALAPIQQRNWEEFLQVKVIDRTALILDIFAQRAKTREGQLQVELAQANYLLPRLTGKGVLLSRLGGGIGTRGPGETKLEVDRRRIRMRIQHLQQELESVRQARALQRQGRQEKGLPIVALVGYTNAGKSTLFNRLTGANIRVEDRLFSTLDPTLRRLRLSEEQTVILSDTVGFIRKLPHLLVEAFRATLEEVIQATLLLHVVDISSPEVEEQIQAVQEVLKEIGAGDKPSLLVWNKIDSLVNSYPSERMERKWGEGVMVSAKLGQNLHALKERIAVLLTMRTERW
jgi:GTP-binding protein HflX